MVFLKGLWRKYDRVCSRICFTLYGWSRGWQKSGEMSYLCLFSRKVTSCNVAIDKELVCLDVMGKVFTKIIKTRLQSITE